MVQVVPQFQINQIFEQTPDATTNALRALLVGPDYAVRKYENGKSLVSLGVYSDVDLAVNWPGRLAGEVVDQSYTKVRIDSAACSYYTDNQTDTQAVSGKPNRISSPTKSWATNGSFTRSGGIPCDVAVGDWVRCSIGSTSQVTSVTGLIADVVASTIGTLTNDGGNIATTAGSSTATAGLSNTGTAAADVSTAANPADYHAENVGVHGQLSETYTLTVIAVGAHGTGNAGNWDTVQLQVTSASGTDPVMTVTPVVNTLINIGSRGAQVSFNHGVSGDDWVLGDTYTVVVNEAFTRPTLAQAGTYTGATDTTYLIQVTKGGLSGVAQIMVSTADGSDSSGPHTVTSGSPIVIGNFGVTVTFTGSKFVVGDQYTLTVTAAASGAIKTLQLANDLQSGLLSAPLKVELALVKDVLVPMDRTGHAPLVNWSQSATQVTLKAGILTSDARVPSTDLEILTGNAYVTYRALRTAGANVVLDISSTADVLTHLSGLDDPDTGASYGAYRALENSAGTVVKVLTVGTDDLAGYNLALSKLKEREDIYRFVPLTQDEAVIDAVISIVTQRSGSTVGRWATCMMALAVKTETQVVGGGSQAATIVDDPDTGGTQYTLVNDASGQFITKGVRAGDEFRAVFMADGFGGATYSSFVVDHVVSEQRLLLVAGPAIPVNVASKYEIWRALTPAEQVADWGARTQARSNRRVTSVFPPNPGRLGTKVPSYYLACSLAALRGASAPHQGLTNASVAGWDDLSECTATYADLLDTVANFGGYIVTQSPAGAVYVRKQLTTDLSDTKHAEDSATTNLDSISYYFKNLFAPKVGKSNVVPSNLDGLTADANAGISFLKTSGATTALGGQIGTNSALIFLRPHATLLDTIVARIQLDLPIPLNNGILDIVV